MKMRAFAGLAAIALLTACAGVTPVGRNASPSAPRAPEPPRAATTTQTAPLPPPAPRQTTQPTQAQSAPLPPPPAETQPPVASEARVSPAPRPAPRADDDEIVVESTREGQVPPPQGDPRSNAERMRDVRAWDQCVMRAQSAAESDPMRPAMDTPEELCARSLGMSDRFAVPISRR